MTRLVRFYVGGNPGDAVVSADQHAVRAARAARVIAFHGVDAATILPAVGVWRGAVEASMVVEVLTDDEPGPLADGLRAEFGQDCVLVVEIGVSASRLCWRAGLPAETGGAT